MATYTADLISTSSRLRAGPRTVLAWPSTWGGGAARQWTHVGPFHRKHDSGSTSNSRVTTRHDCLLADELVQKSASCRPRSLASAPSCLHRRCDRMEGQLANVPCQRACNAQSPHRLPAPSRPLACAPCRLAHRPVCLLATRRGNHPTWGTRPHRP